MKAITARSLQAGFLFFLIAGIIILALSGYLAPVTRLVLDPIIKAQTWVSERYQAVQDFITAPGDLARLRQRNAELEAENSRLQIQVIELQQQVAEAEVLSTLVGYARTRVENRYIAASVIGYDTSPFMHYIIIDRGSDAGLRRGMPVVTNQGLVGQIASVTSGAARVQLITDPSSAVNIHLQKAEGDGVLVGSVTGELQLTMIPQNVNVQPGELVVTSGLGGNYPSNLVVGQVTSVRRRDFELFQTAAIQPAVDFRRLQIVLIIINFQPVNIAPLVPQSTTP